MREQYSSDLKMLVGLELERNERVGAVVAAYEDLVEVEKALFRLAVGISQDEADEAREPRHRSRNEGNERAQPAKVQPLVQNLMKSLLEECPSFLTESDMDNLMDRDYCQKTLNLQIGGFPLLRRREAGRKGSENDRQDRFYAKPYAGRFYVCSQWWREDHLANARVLLRFVGELAGQKPDHPEIPVLERHMAVLRGYIGRNASLEMR